MYRTALLLMAACLPVIEGDVRVRLPTGVVEMPLERYVAAVLAGEASVFRSDEALKAMAVAARTYAVRLRGRHSKEGFDFCVTTHCQRIDLKAITPRLEKAVDDTAGELLWFEGKPAFAVYTRDCGGRTEEVSAVWPEFEAPYLKSHEDPYCLRAGLGQWQWAGSGPEILAALRASQLRAPATLEQIVLRQSRPSGRAEVLALVGGGQTVPISASSFRFALGRRIGWNTLRSDGYRVRVENGRFVFEGTGAGHGVGLCQRGADEMGVEGKSYRDILAFYYPGTVVGLTGRGLKWARLGGESVAVLTTQPDRDAGLVAIAERIGRGWAERTKWAWPAGVEIRVYPDVETFRNATGEPGWVAAQTRGSRVEMQPSRVLRERGALDSTLRHELLHVLVESRAKTGLPVWFREGVVEWFADGADCQSAAGCQPAPQGLRSRSDQAAARAGYAEARKRVDQLVSRYGAETVLAWVTLGLPPELKNSMSNQDTTKSK